MTPISRRSSGMRAGGRRETLRPATRIWPALGRSAPNSSRSSVVLPAPLDPVRNANSPRAIVTEMSRMP
jgi:hypothetical protein